MNVKAMAAIALTLIIAVPIGVGYLLNIEEVDRNVWFENDPKNITNLISNSYQDIFIPYTGAENNNFASNGGEFQSLDFVNIGSTVSPIPVYSMTGTYNWNVSTGVNNPDDNFGPVWSFSVTTDQMTNMSFSLTNGYTQGVTVAATTPATTYTVVKTSDNYIVDGSTTIPADTVTGVRFTFKGSYTIPVTVQAISGYANTSYGWHATDDDTGYFWSNNHNNSSLLMTINMPSATSFDILIQLPDNFNTSNSRISISKDGSGNVSVSTYSKQPEVSPVLLDSADLGNYQFIRLEINYSSSQLVVSGLASWPPMTSNPVLYNSKTLDLHKIPGYSVFSRLYFNDPAGSNIYRIDRATISAGTYPTATDVTINPKEYYPQLDSLKLTISKIGIVGDSITFAGETYQVTDGQITIGSSKQNVENIVFRSTTDDGVTWHNYVNKRQVGDTSAVSTIGLGGTWSAIYTLSDLDMRTETAPEWIPGGFGIDQDMFALIGLMTCAALTVLLGMYGVRSGVKVLWLMMATGGAALVFVFML